MRTGLFALAHLDTSPLLPEDVRTLRLEAARTSAEAVRMHVEDAGTAGAASCFEGDDGWCIFLGELEDARTAASKLACDEHPAVIALAAVRQWGPRAGDRLKGEWSLLCRPSLDGPVWLGASRLLRDRIYFSFSRSRLAVSGELPPMARLSWIETGFERLNFALAMSRNDAARRGARATLIPGVGQLEAGAFHQFEPDGRHIVHDATPDVALSWQGGFGDAVTDLEGRLGDVMRTMMGPHERVALFMSGGLDSALVARFAAQARRPGQQIIALTAVAPPASTRDDERRLAADTAQAFDLPHRLVWPAEGAQIYRPVDTHFAEGELSLSPRHYLYRALFEAACDFGATAIIDGASGEASISRTEETDLLRARARDGALRLRRLLDRRGASPGRARPFQVQLAPALLALLTEDRPAGPSPAAPTGWKRPRDPMGWPPNHHRQWRTPSRMTGEIPRRMRPLRDHMLVAMVAAMPATFTSRHGHDRALARAMLEGHVPERVTRQRKGPAFSVDYDERLVRDAPSLLGRIASWRQAKVDDWLDLGWLNEQVRRSTDQGFGDVGTRFLVQSTAIAAEFLTYWRRHGLC